MSVAEVLNGEICTPNVDIRKSKYYAGLKLDDLGTNTTDHYRRADDDGHFAPESSDRAHALPQAYGAHIHEPQRNNSFEHRNRRHHNSEDAKWLRNMPMRDRIDGEEETTKRRQNDLFLDTLGGPGGTVLRQNGRPPLMNRIFTQQQQQFQQRQTTTESQVPEEYKNTLDGSNEDRQTARNQQRIEDLRRQIDHITYSRGEDRETDYKHSYNYLDLRTNSKLSERRSLDLENTKGGSGAPIKDPWGKNVTRMAITLSKDDCGESNIVEDIPGKATFDLDFTNDDNKPYYPWGSQGGGAPIRNRDGHVVTHVFGKLEGKNTTEGENRRNKRRQEVLYNELKECVRQQRENKAELDRYMKAPQAELAELMLAGRAGKPKRDAITGEVGQQHLPNSDVSKWKMNYQPVPMSEKKRYHDELVRMAEERHILKQLERLKEKQESIAHFQNMDSTWGHYGGGAPKHHVIRKKVNLTNSLFYPQEVHETQRFEDQDYMPPTGLGSFEYIESPHLNNQKLYTDDVRESHLSTAHNLSHQVKSTVRSSHKNLFETAGDSRLAGTGRHHLAPYATDLI